MMINDSLGEDFVFEPYLSGQYGDCFGNIVHFEPKLPSNNQSKIYPFYSNAEILSEKEIGAVGNFITDIITEPVLVHPDMRLYDMFTWIHHRHMHNCTCRHDEYECGSVEQYQPIMNINEEILLIQWITLSMRVKWESNPYDQCVMIRKSIISALNHLFQSRITPADCHIIGCPYLPIEYNVSSPSDEFCDPISFLNSQSDMMKLRAKRARFPIDWGVNQLFSFMGSKKIFLLENGSLHHVPNMDMIYKLNLDITKVHRLHHPHEVAPIGSPL
jgi:hypothetical protein